MNRSILLIIITISSFSLSAQSGIFLQRIRQGLVNFYAAQDLAGFHMASEYFNELAKNNEGEYLPDYYAAMVMLAEMDFFPAITDRDSIADSALAHVHAAEILRLDNSEIEVLWAYALYAKMKADPNGRADSYAPEIASHLQKALSLKADNPRALLWKGVMMMQLPMYFENETTSACDYIKNSLPLFATQNTEGYVPQWGVETGNEMVKNCN